jgi:heme exporter protein D
MNLGPHAAFIISAYAIASAAIVALVAWIVVDYRRQLRALRKLESEGAVRRSRRGGRST